MPGRKKKSERTQLIAKAHEIYNSSNLGYAEIAELVGVSRDTVGDWAREFGWKEAKAAQSLTREKNIKNWLHQIDNLNNVINGRPLEQRYATPSEADTFTKMTNNIAKLSGRTSLPDFFNVQTEFLKFLHNANPALAKQVADYNREFLQAKTRELDA